MPVEFYRYMSYPQELDQVSRHRKVQSTNPTANYATWYTPTKYDDPRVAQQELALKREPTHRIGPIPADHMPSFDVALRPVAPANGQSGGGVEARTTSPVWIFGLLDFQTRTWTIPER